MIGIKFYQNSRLFFIIILIFTTFADFTGSNLNMDTIPNDFLIGFSTASYQIEGAWNEDGKGESVWDRFTHSNPNMILDKSNGDIAADSYHKYKEDVQILKQLNSQVYRFSLSWPRILPTGDITKVNQAGVDYYNNLIDELIKNDIQPMVTLFHWDLPQVLQDFGGWVNPLMIDYFTDYALFVFKTFGDRVKLWITFNEPFETCEHHYGNTIGAPALNLVGIGNYLAAHTIILAHAKVYHLYHEKYNLEKTGKISISLNGNWHQAKTTIADDIKAAENAMQFTVGWFGHPIFSKSGDYPSVMRTAIDHNSKLEGRERSRLPKFTEQEIQYIKGTYDFFGLNHYTSCLVEANTDSNNQTESSWKNDLFVKRSFDPSWTSARSWWLQVVPWGLRHMLLWIKNEYNNVPVFITENGYSDDGQLEDLARIDYYKRYLAQVMKAIKIDGCNVIGYTAWSLLDNFEWRQGYTEKFGICQVNFADANRTRTLKKSAEFFRELITTRKLSVTKILEQEEDYKYQQTQDEEL